MIMKEIFDKNARELAELGVIDGLELNKAVIENWLDVTLVDCTSRYGLYKTYSTIKVFRVIDPGTEGSSDLLLFVYFNSTNFVEPVSFCFVNSVKGWIASIRGKPVPRIFVTSFDGEGEKNFEPFNELTKEAYLTSAAQSAKENV
jgi:hypothetical protein